MNDDNVGFFVVGFFIGAILSAIFMYNLTQIIIADNCDDKNYFSTDGVDRYECHKLVLEYKERDDD